MTSCAIPLQEYALCSIPKHGQYPCNLAEKLPNADDEGEDYYMIANQTIADESIADQTNTNVGQSNTNSDQSIATPSRRITLNTTAQLPAAIAPQRSVRRSITPQAGHALEILGHAIEYLTDEYVHDRGFLNPDDERMETVQLLMQLNRRVYSECPVLPTFSERCRSLMYRVLRHNMPHSPLA